MKVNRRIKYLCISLLLAAFTNGQNAHCDTVTYNANESFKFIKSLCGNWKGTYEWLGTEKKGLMNVKYYLTGNGTAVIEDLMQGDTAVMTSIYHMDGKDLRLTHYCAAGNQPRLKASKTNKQYIEFEFIDITNLKNKDAGHVNGIELKQVSDTRLEIVFTFLSAGKERKELIKLQRN